MPQIDQAAQIFASQFFWLVMVFALLYFGIGKAMLPKIQRTVDDRDAKIRGDLAAAEAARAVADAAEEGYVARLTESRTAAQAETAAAKARATAAAEGRVKAADAALAERMAHAAAALAAQRDRAMGEIEIVAIEATQEVVQRVTGQAVDRGAAAVAVTSVMAQG